MANSIVSSSLDALTQKYTQITLNLANASTVGFKRRVDEFVLASQAAGDAEAPQEIQVSSTVDFSQGSLVHSGRSLDFALNGKGFFVVETPEGRAYTRNGQFRFSANGQLVDFVGRTVAGANGPIILPGGVSAQDFNVAIDGTAYAKDQVIGKLLVVDFKNASNLSPIGDSSFRAADGASPEAATDTAVRQGFTESSNVSVVGELVDLITVTRMYEANFRMLQTEDERMKQILNVAMS